MALRSTRSRVSPRMVRLHRAQKVIVKCAQSSSLAGGDPLLASVHPFDGEARNPQ